MVACDTFRSGVEQLRAKIPIFEKGYEKDPVVAGKEAKATPNGSDLVLVDTAGRMQDFGVLVIPTAPGPPPKIRTEVTNLEGFRVGAFLAYFPLLEYLDFARYPTWAE